MTSIKFSIEHKAGMCGIACIVEDKYSLNSREIHLQVVVSPGKSNGVIILSLFYEILLVEWL